MHEEKEREGTGDGAAEERGPQPEEQTEKLRNIRKIPAPQRRRDQNKEENYFILGRARSVSETATVSAVSAAAAENQQDRKNIFAASAVSVSEEGTVVAAAAK